jgi:hypothetical protein
MSIWSSFGGVEGLYEVASGKLGDPQDPNYSYVDLADARSWYGNSAIRIVMETPDEGEVCAVITREQVAKLARDLQDWLTRTADKPDN